MTVPSSPSQTALMDLVRRGLAGDANALGTLLRLKQTIDFATEFELQRRENDKLNEALNLAKLGRLEHNLELAENGDAGVRDGLRTNAAAWLAIATAGGEAYLTRLRAFLPEEVADADQPRFITRRGKTVRPGETGYYRLLAAHALHKSDPERADAVLTAYDSKGVEGVQAHAEISLDTALKLEQVILKADEAELDSPHPAS